MKMNKKQLQFDRLLAVLHQNSDYITAKSLSEQLNLSEKTVYRLVKEINQDEDVILSLFFITSENCYIMIFHKSEKL